MMTGAWESVALELMNLPKKRDDARDFVLEESTKLFHTGIQAEVKKNNIHPKDDSFSADEYAQKIKKDQVSTATVFVGIKKNEMIRGSDVGAFAVSAEFGLQGTPYLGVWRRFMTRFNRTVKLRLDAISQGRAS